MENFINVVDMLKLLGGISVGIYAGIQSAKIRKRFNDRNVMIIREKVAEKDLSNLKELVGKAKCEMIGETFIVSENTWMSDNEYRENQIYINVYPNGEYEAEIIDELYDRDATTIGIKRVLILSKDGTVLCSTEEEEQHTKNCIVCKDADASGKLLKLLNDAVQEKIARTGNIETAISSYRYKVNKEVRYFEVKASNNGMQNSTVIATNSDLTKLLTLTCDFENNSSVAINTVEPRSHKEWNELYDSSVYGNLCTEMSYDEVVGQIWKDVTINAVK